MTKIFICYRREDSADVVGRIFDHLERRFGRDRLFLDIDAIRYGDDFRRRIGGVLDETGVMLVIIGDRWLDAADRGQGAGGRRLDDPDDYVSLEISSALERGISVVPVLVGEAEMPRSSDLPAHLIDLSYRNAAEIRSGKNFSFQLNRLITAIADLLGLPQEQSSLRGTSTQPRLSVSFETLAGHPESLIGVQLGAFIIERLLAAGGSGIAYVGRNPRTGQRVCVKVSLPVLSDMDGIRRALSRGIRGIVALNHPHIVRIQEFDGLEFADAAQSFYVVMDYVEGVVLDRWAASLPPNRDGLRDFIRIAFLVARALGAAHSSRYIDDAGFETVGVVHGDVKPGNILVRADRTPALLDFMMLDVHRVVDLKSRERLAMRDSALTLIFGTPGFMAPEQEREGIVTVRTDVYGLGATLRFAAPVMSLPSDLISLLDRMTGPVTERPQDMAEVARVLADVARRGGIACEEMNEQTPTTERGERGLLSAIASLFRQRRSSPPRSSPDAIASVEASATRAHLEVPAIFSLRVLTGPYSGTVWPLKTARVTVGRSPQNDVDLPREKSLSRSHFALNWSAERRTFVAIDFGAPVPVLINGEPLAGSQPLAPGDLLTIGSTELVFERSTTK